MSMHLTKTVLATEQHDGVLLITLNRPDRANTLNDAVLHALATQINEIERGTSVRAAVITGSGTKAFCAGADVTELADLNPDDARAKMRHGQEVFRRLELLPIPTVAAINGYALGGGLELAMACDLRIASASARMGQPEIALANVPGWGGTQRLPRLIGLGRATELILTGEQIDAAEALRVGLVNQVVPDNQVIDAALALAKRLAARSPAALAGAKRAIHIGLDDGLAAGCAAEADAVAGCCQTSAQREAVASFLNRRKTGSDAGRPEESAYRRRIQ